MIAITGQSNAAGAAPGGPDPASVLVRAWDPSQGDWGRSGQTEAPWTSLNPDGNLGNANYALARAHRVAETTGRPVFIVLDAVGGSPIKDWTAAPPLDIRFEALDTKVTNALGHPVLAQHNLAGIDELIFAQGEADYESDFDTHLAELRLFNEKIRGTSWFGAGKPCYMMSPASVHDRYLWREALKFHCRFDDNDNIFVPSAGLETEFEQTGSGDNSHFLGESLWRGGYYNIERAAVSEGTSSVLWGRGTGPASPADETVLCTFSNLVSRDSWTADAPADGPVATGSISWGGDCHADGSFTAAFGRECTTSNLANYGMLSGRQLNASEQADYFAAFGFQNELDAPFTLASGRGHQVCDEGATAVGLFSEYESPQSDGVLFQVGSGNSQSDRQNALAVRKSGAIEAKALPVYPDNTAAQGAGLTVGTIYATGTGELRIVV